jgi:hypothetical protein
MNFGVKMNYRSKPTGWRYESTRHSLAAQGISSSKSRKYQANTALGQRFADFLRAKDVYREQKVARAGTLQSAQAAQYAQAVARQELRPEDASRMEEYRRTASQPVRDPRFTSARAQNAKAAVEQLYFRRETAVRRLADDLIELQKRADRFKGSGSERSAIILEANKQLERVNDVSKSIKEKSQAVSEAQKYFKAEDVKRPFTYLAEDVEGLKSDLSRLKDKVNER